MIGTKAFRKGVTASPAVTDRRETAPPADTSGNNRQLWLKNKTKTPLQKRGEGGRATFLVEIQGPEEAWNSSQALNDPLLDHLTHPTNPG